MDFVTKTVECYHPSAPEHVNQALKSKGLVLIYTSDVKAVQQCLSDIGVSSREWKDLLKEVVPVNYRTSSLDAVRIVDGYLKENFSTLGGVPFIYDVALGLPIPACTSFLTEATLVIEGEHGWVVRSKRLPSPRLKDEALKDMLQPAPDRDYFNVWTKGT